MNRALEAALELHKALNCNVFPIPRGSKKPTLSWRAFQKRRLTPDEVEELFSPSPNANIAVVCGKISGLLVLDADAPDVLRRWGHPETPVAETSRGQHIYFRLPIGMSVRSTTAIANGLDIRAEGGYVLAPPSLHPTGKSYSWIIPPVGYLPVEPAPPPSWLLELIRKQRARKVNIKSAIHGVDEGARNDSAAAIAGKLLAALRPDDWPAIAWPLLKAWNALNKPPLPVRELRQVFESIARSELKRRSGSIEARLLNGLRRLRQQLRLSQRRLSCLTGIPQRTLARWLAADTAPYTYILTGGDSKKSLKIRMEANFDLKSEPRVIHGDFDTGR